MGPRLAYDLTVELDYGVFAVQGDGEADVEGHAELIDEATAGTGIAADGRSVVVLSPHQNNFSMPLRVEVWESPPPDDLSEWEEAFEASLEIGPDGELLYVSPTVSPRTVPVPPGRYRMRIVGRGFVSRGWPGSTRPGDRWRIQLWPAETWSVPQRLAMWEPDR